jgi:uncharacterized protein with ATP-grasp and redox domains
MKTYLDCYPCFFQQILNALRMMGVDEGITREILIAFGPRLSRVRTEATPPEIGREAYRLIAEKTGILDPYESIKKKCTQQALALYPQLKERIAVSGDRLRMAARMAIAGNVIDFGANADFDLDRDLANLLSQDLAIDHFDAFRRCLEKAQKVLYLADNAGETVFDRLLIEEMGKSVVYAVREKPIINDAVLKDALDAGLQDVSEVVSSGSDAPGTILDLCSEDFKETYRSADLVISKGQGNYEGLSGETRPVFFLLKAKCSVIARDIGVEQGSLILMKAANFDFSQWDVSNII